MPGAEPMPQAPGEMGLPQAPAPSGTPSTNPIPPAGELEIAKSNVSIAISLLEKQLGIFGAGSEEGEALLRSLVILSKKFSGTRSEDVAPAELMQVMGAQPDKYKQAMLKEMSASGAPPTVGAGAPQAPAPPQF